MWFIIRIIIFDMVGIATDRLKPDRYATFQVEFISTAHRNGGDQHYYWFTGGT